MVVQIVPLVVLFGLLAFSVFRPGYLVNLAIIICSIFMAIKGVYAEWLAPVFVLIALYGAVRIIGVARS